MTIASEILKAQNNLKDCYDVCSSVDGVVLPEEKNFDNLSALIEQALDPLNKPPFNKPADWADIRTDCPENSIALYAGHTADYSQYDNLGFIANCVGGYNVFIDGVQYGNTYASGSNCSIIWSTSGITTGDDITTPVALKAHKIWICSAVEGNNITLFKCSRVAESGIKAQGVLWGHFNLTNAIDISYAFNYPNIAIQSMLVAITAKNNILNFSGNLTWSINYNEKINYITALNQSSSDYIYANQVFSSTAIKKIVIKNFKPITLQASFYNANSLTSINYKEWDLSNCTIVYLPNYTNYQNVDLTNNTVLKKFVLNGTSNKLSTLKSLRVSNEAPFDGTAPQINVSYTGLDRAALVQLFEDLPYNVGYEVVGNPTISNGVVSGFSTGDFLKFSNTPSFSNPTEIVVKAKFTTFESASNLLGWVSSGSWACYFSVLTTGKIGCYFQRTVASPNDTRDIWGNFVLSLNTWYWLKLVKTDTTLSLYYSTDGINYNLDATATFDSMPSFSASFVRLGCGGGYNPAGPTLGSIDLNETYIKVNDVYWFRGQPTMTKTLSCVGATGTANLTQEDKDIALNKGWSVTIS